MLNQLHHRAVCSREGKPHRYFECKFFRISCQGMFEALAYGFSPICLILLAKS